MNLPSLFGATGAFQKLSDDVRGSLSEAHAVAYEKIEKCADDLAASEYKLAHCVDHAKACADAVVEFEQWMAATFPKLTFHDLWKAEFGRK